MNCKKNTLNEQPQFGHSKNKSIITNQPLIHNQYICNLLERNNMLKTNNTNRQDITSCCSKVSTTFVDILASEQKRNDAMHIIKTFKNGMYPRKENTFLRSSQEKYNQNTVNNKTTFPSSLFQESPIISYNKKETNTYKNNDNDPKNDKTTFNRKNKKKHLSQEIMKSNENSKNNNFANQKMKANYMQGGYYDINQDNKHNTFKNNGLFYCFDSPNPDQKDKETKTKIIYCSPIRSILNDERDYNDNQYEYEKVENLTINGIKKKHCYNSMFIEHLKDINIILAKNKNDSKSITNVASFTFDKIIKPGQFHQIKIEESNQITLIALNSLVKGKTQILAKPISSPNVFSKEIKYLSKKEMKNIELIQNTYKRYYYKQKKKNKNGNLTGIIISFYYKGNLYTKRLIELNNKFGNINKELSEIKLKGYNDYNYFVQLRETNVNNLVFEAKHSFCINQSVPKLNLIKNNLSHFLIESSTLFILNTTLKEKSKDNRKNIIQSCHLIAISSLLNNNTQSINNKEKIDLDKNNTNNTYSNLNLKVDDNIKNSLINNNHLVNQQEVIENNEEIFKEIKPDSIQFDTISTISNIDNSQIAQNETNSNSIINNTEQKQNVSNKYKKLQTEIIKHSKLNINTLFSGEDKVKQYIDDKPISKNKKKPKFTNFDENKSQANEIDNMTSQIADEGKKKASQLRKKMKSSKIISTKQHDDE